jgi:hypothetical protein
MTTQGKIFKTILIGLEKQSPTILSGLGIAGIATTVILAVRATPKALYILQEEKAARYTDESKREPISKIDMIKLTWKCYIPATLVGVGTVACFVGAHSINLRRNAVLAGLYTVSTEALKEYQEKVIEVIGQNKENKIREAILEDKLKENPVSKNEILLTGTGEVLFYDSWSGRYFKSEMERVRKIQNDLNHRLLTGQEAYLPLNSFYYDLGIHGIDAGEDIGWSFDEGMLDINFTTKIADNGVPCVVIQYKIQPKFFK